MNKAMRRKHFSLNTEKTYTGLNRLYQEWLMGNVQMKLALMICGVFFLT